MNHAARIAALLVAGGVFLLCALFGVLAVLLMRQLSGVCEPMGRGALTSPRGNYQAGLTRDECDANAGTLYLVTVVSDTDGFEEPGVRSAVGGEGLSDGDAVRVRRSSDDELVISGDSQSNVNVVLRSSGVSVRRGSP